MKLKFFSRYDWDKIAEDAHMAIFRERRPAGFERVDFALLAVDNEDKPVGYVTGFEINSELIQWRFGGVFPDRQRTKAVIDAYRLALDWTRQQRWTDVITLVKNDNIASLKLHMAHGWRIVGVQLYGGDVLLELHLTLKVNEHLKEKA